MAGSPPLDPSDLEQATFDVVRKGFDPKSVQRTLQRAADALRELERQRAELADQVNELETTPTASLEAHRVAEALGLEAAAVLEAAHAAAADRAERAEREAEAVRAESLAAAEQARTEATVLRDEAAMMTEHARSEAAVIRAEVATEVEQAKAAAETIRDDAAAAGRAEAEDTLAEARRQAEQIIEDGRREAEQIVEDGRRRGRDMVNEAQIVRERMLGDLARKRQTGRAQVEQLRAGRDRLLESLSIAQSNLDTAMKDLVDAVPEARGAAERAGLRIANEAAPTVEALEAEIEAARLVGHPLVEGIADPDSPVDDVVEEPDPSFVTAEMEALTHIDQALETTDESEGEDDRHEEPEEPAGERDELEHGEPEVDMLDEGDESDEDDGDGAVAADVDADEADGDLEPVMVDVGLSEETTDEAGEEESEPVAVELDEGDSASAEAAIDDESYLFAGPDADEVSEVDELFAGPDTDIDDEADDGASEVDEPAIVDLRDADPEPMLAELDDSVPDPDAMLAEQVAVAVGADDADGESEVVAEPEADAVGDLFARLRDAQPDDAQPDEEQAAEPEPADVDGLDEEDEEAEPVAATDDAEPEPDPFAAARERAVSVATRALKKVVVEEQGTLLDGIRRTGGDAVSVVVADADAHATAYEEAATPAFTELIEALGGSADQLADGFAQLRTVALDPVRQRLLDVAADSDDADELSDVVRGLYRESRSRRIPMAVGAAVTAVTGAVTVATAAGSVQWVVDPDGDCGPDCADNALAGPISPGDAFPTGALHPPTDPTCTCRLVVVG